MILRGSEAMKQSPKLRLKIVVTIREVCCTQSHSATSPRSPSKKKGGGDELILHSKIENYTLNQIHSKSKQRVKFLKQRPKK